MRPPPLLVRVLLPGSGGKVLVAGGAPGANNPRTITLGREHICRGFKKRTFVSREVCVIDAAGTTATVAALATAKRPVVLERRSLSAPCSSSFSSSSSSGLQRITLRPEGPPTALQDRDILHLFPAEKGEEDEEEQAAMQRVVVEVEGGGGVEVEERAEQQQQQSRCYSSTPLIMLFLVGLPGSGKTRLANALLAHAKAAASEFRAADTTDDDDSYGEEEEEEGNEAAAAAKAAKRRRRRQNGKPPLSWTRVCPDGSSEAACLEAAGRALAEGDCVVVDRTNLTAAGRAKYLADARKHGAEAHALFLDRGRQECLVRAYERTEHEGGVTGQTAAIAVNVLAKGPLDVPSCEGEEGFVRVLRLRDDAANDAAAEEYGRGRVGTTRESGGGGGVAGGAGGGGGGGGGSKRSAFEVLLAPPAKKAGATPASPPAATSSAPRKALDPFLNALRLISENPERAGAGVSRAAGDETGARLLVLRDKFPKARSHALVLQESSSSAPGAARVIASPRDLRPEDAGLVRDLLAAGRRWAAAQQQQGGCVDFRFGFHSEPSLEPMHLHAISQDLLGPALKTKKHYNSFKSPFFVDAEEVLAALERRGQGEGPEAEAPQPPRLPLLSPEEAKRALAAPLACHRCGAPMKNMPALRAHLEEEEERRRRGGAR